MRGWLFLAALAACGGAAQSVPVRGSDEDISMLAGRWEGSYQGTDSGREGSVSLDLALGHHVAEGQVLMYPTGAGPEKAQPLGIKFVQMKKGEISGKIGPYTDPACSCSVETEFVGTVAGDNIDGTFTTHGVGTAITQTGRWQAVRKK